MFLSLGNVFCKLFKEENKCKFARKEVAAQLPPLLG